MILVETKDNKYHTVEPTIFPDGTSQVWKLPENITGVIKYESDFPIDEAEMFQLMQAVQLVSKLCGSAIIVIPFLPYSRQDKEISNDSTFALTTFMTCLKACGASAIYTHDLHGMDTTNSLGMQLNSSCVPLDLLTKLKTDFVCYPDKGASSRYKYISFNKDKTIVLDKDRDQLTGEILGLKYCEETHEKLDIKGKNVTIVDDICDGGRTFIEAAKLLKQKNPAKITLYVSHGIFSKGTKVLYDAGIDEIYTHKGKKENDYQSISTNRCL